MQMQYDTCDGKHTILVFFMHTHPHLRRTALVYRALSNERRLYILQVLSTDSYIECDLAAKLKIRPASLSRHLHLLIRAGFIYGRRHANQVRFSVVPGLALQQLLDHRNMFSWIRVLRARKE